MSSDIPDINPGEIRPGDLFAATLLTADREDYRADTEKKAERRKTDHNACVCVYVCV